MNQAEAYPARPGSTGKLILPFAAFLFPYVLALIFSDAWWGAHYTLFLPSLGQLGLGAAVLALLVWAWTRKKALPELNSLNHGSAYSFLIIAIGLIAGIIFHSLPLLGDNYGNAMTFLPDLDQKVSTLDDNFWSSLFSFEFKPGNGRQGVVQLVYGLAYAADLTLGEAFRWMDSLCGVGFVWLWLFFVKAGVKTAAWRLLLSLAGTVAPFALLFFGHTETYAPVLLLMLGFWVLLFQFLKQKKSYQLWLLLPLALLGTRLHTLFGLYLLVWLLAVIRYYAGENKWVQKLFSPKGFALYLLLPLFLLGLVLYFFVFEDYQDPRILQDFADIDRLFLPLIAPEAPLDSYNLLSPSHFIDFVNSWLHAAPLAWFLFGYLAFFRRKEINWKRPEVLLPALVFVVLELFLFAINPLFSLPMDWDLFCLPVPALLVLLVALASQLEEKPLSLKMLPFGLVFVLLSLPTFVVNLNVESRSYRLERVSVWMFKTYYEHSAKNLHYGIGLVPDDLNLYLKRKEKVIRELESHAQPGKDVKYASMLTDNGFYYQKALIDPAKAREYFQKAYTYDPGYGLNLIYLMESNFMLQDFASAHENALALIGIGHPTRPKALRFGVHTALEAGLYPEAQQHAQDLLRLDPGDKLMQEVVQRIEAQDRVGEIKFLFSRR